MKGKIRSYSFDKYGLAQAKLDIANKKKTKISNVTNFAIMMVMVMLGFIGKEFFVVYLINLGFGFLGDLLG